MRLNSRTGTEGSPMSSLNCDRPLHSGIRAPEFNECRLLTLIGARPYVLRHSTACTRLPCTLLGWAGQIPGPIGIAVGVAYLRPNSLVK